MSDLFLLSMLSKGVKVLEKTYFVAWDSKLSKALITYTIEGVDGMKQFTFADGSEMRFPTELDAHRYLTGLRYLVQTEFDENGWKNL